jgi:hypothetical protein
MMNDDLQKNMGGAGRDEGQNLGQHSQGRSGQGGQQGGQNVGGYGGSQEKSNYGGGGQMDRDMEDDDLGAGGAQTGGQGRGTQNR